LLATTIDAIAATKKQIVAGIKKSRLIEVVLAETATNCMTTI